MSIFTTFNYQDVLDSKNSAIKDLQYELARVCKVRMNVPIFQPSNNNTPIQYGLPRTLMPISKNILFLCRHIMIFYEPTSPN